MLDQVNLDQKLSKAEYKQLCSPLKKQLSVLQQTVKEKRLPMVVVFEGWSAAGKGSLLSDVILTLDPRGFKVYSTVAADPAEARKPLLWRYWIKIPAEGNMSLFDRSWYQDLYIAQTEQEIEDSEWERRVQSINTMERQLSDEGYLIVKFFLHISQEEQRLRFEKLADSKNTSWRVTERDWKRNKQYRRYYKAADLMMERTHTSYAPWHTIPSHDKRFALYRIYSTLIDSIQKALERKERKESPREQLKDTPACVYVPKTFTLLPMPSLQEVPLDAKLSSE